jgi:hypothetical protein
MTIDPPPPRFQPSAAQRLFGAVLMAIGGMIALLCGLCSFGVLGAAFMSPSPGEGLLFSLVLVGIFGGIPFAVGLGVFLIGRGVYRDHSKPKAG